MIIKPIKTDFEFNLYGNARNNYTINQYTGLIQNNTSKDKVNHEFDAYDLHSFHFGAFMDNEMHACSRMVNDTKGVQKFSLDTESRERIKDLNHFSIPTNGLALQDYISGKEFRKVDELFSNLRANNKTFNEIGRLIRCIKQGEKHLVNYLICYAWAFGRFYEIDYCYLGASKSHSKYYQKFFNCKPVLEQIEFQPIDGGEPYYLMQATSENLTPQMDLLVNRMLSKFREAGAPCAVNIDEIR